MPKNILIELGVEELPASYINNAINSFHKNFKKLLDNNNIDFEKSIKYATPRRLVLFFKDVVEKEPDRKEKRVGPPKNVCFDDSNNKTKAYTSFINRNGVDEKDLYWEEKDKGKYLAVVKHIEGKKTKNLVKNNLKNIVKNIDVPKKMVWNSTKFMFARPIRWLQTWWGENLLDIEIAKVKSKKETYLLRQKDNPKRKIKNIDDYFKKIKESEIILSFENRKKLIRKEIEKIVDKNNADTFYSSDLIDEVANLVEAPLVLEGEFNEKFLELPPEIISAAMSQHQRYFSLYKNENIIPKFIFVANGSFNNPEEVIRGNQRVLNGRLDDAYFYWQEDTKKEIDELNNKLSRIVWIEGLGTLKDKTERLEKAIEKFHTTDKAKQMAHYSKIDIGSEMIKDGKEFTKLQGNIAKYYLLEANFSEEIAKGIEEHYYPEKWGETLPKTEDAKYLSVIDKLDDIVGAFINGYIPTGSKDPYALKRKFNSVLAIILGYESGSISVQKQIDLEIFDIVDYLYSLYPKEDNKYLLLEFMWERIEYQFEKLGIPKDIVKAVVETKNDTIIKLFERAKAFKKLSKSKDFKKVAFTFKRVNNIVYKAIEKYDKKLFESIEKNLLEEDEEKRLYKQWKKYYKKLQSFEKDKKYNDFFDIIIKLKPVVDEFFDNVMVMDKDKNLRNNRLALLKEISDFFNKVVKFEHIVVN